MRVIFCGRKNISLEALDYILKKGWSVLPVVPLQPEPSWSVTPTFQQGLDERAIKYTSQKEVLNAIEGKSDQNLVNSFLANPVDLVISYLFPERIKPALLDLPLQAAINFHPAPLPEYGGTAPYTFAIIENKKIYGATAHFMDETFDTGDVILKKVFEYDSESVTALDLERLTRPYLISLFRELMDMIDGGVALPRMPQGHTRYMTMEEFEKSQIIDLEKESAEMIERKARAYWYPPYEGAYINIKGRKFTVIPDNKLTELGKIIHRDIK